jgi:hypothetical protein
LATRKHVCCPLKERERESGPSNTPKAAKENSVFIYFNYV